MDIIQDWASALSSQFTPSRLSTLYTYLSITRTYFLLAVDTLVSSQPSLTTVALLLIIFLISLKILDMLWRAVVFWVRLAVRIVFWGGLAIMGCWIYARGPEGVVEDVGTLAGTWMGEYRKFENKVSYAWKFQDQIGPNARARREGQWNTGSRRKW